MNLKIVFKLIAEIVGTIFIFLILWSAAGRLMTSASDLNVLAGVLLVILTICLLLFVARAIYLQAKEIFSNGVNNG